MSYVGKTIKSLDISSRGRYEGCVGTIVFTDGSRLDLTDETNIEEDKPEDLVDRVVIGLNSYGSYYVGTYCGVKSCVYKSFGGNYTLVQAEYLAKKLAEFINVKIERDL